VSEKEGESSVEHIGGGKRAVTAGEWELPYRKDFDDKAAKKLPVSKVIEGNNS